MMVESGDLSAAAAVLEEDVPGSLLLEGFPSKSLLADLFRFLSRGVSAAKGESVEGPDAAAGAGIETEAKDDSLLDARSWFLLRRYTETLVGL